MAGTWHNKGSTGLPARHHGLDTYRAGQRRSSVCNHATLNVIVKGTRSTSTDVPARAGKPARCHHGAERRKLRLNFPVAAPLPVQHGYRSTTFDQSATGELVTLWLGQTIYRSANAKTSQRCSPASPSLKDPLRQFSMTRLLRITDLCLPRDCRESLAPTMSISRTARVRPCGHCDIDSSQHHADDRTWARPRTAPSFFPALP
jgi:hypothetical protein